MQEARQETKALAVRTRLSKKARAELEKVGSPFRPGDTIVCVSHGWREGQIFRILHMTPKYVRVAMYEEGKWWTEDELGSRCSLDYDELGDYVKLDTDPTTLESDVLRMAQDPEVSLAGPETEISDETALAVSRGKGPLLEAEKSLRHMQNKALVAKAVLARKVRKIRDIVHRYEEGLKKVHKVLHVAELYLGIGEEIVQIREGQAASAGEPIAIRQMLLYMDEEVGDPTEGGLDYQRIEEFDTWVCQPENTAQVLPEARGVVAIRPRRTAKWYVEDPWVNTILNQSNKLTYLLIRNGDNLYRIWMDEVIQPRLFPRHDELKPKEDGKSRGFFDERDLKEQDFNYKKYGVMLQGLIHRTPIFQPLAHDVDLFQAETWGKLVRFVRDDELTLPSGRLSWKAWKESINARVAVGSRIIYLAHRGAGSGRDGMDYDRVAYGLRFVHPPRTGLYTVVAGAEGETDQKHLRFLYDPGDEVWRGRDRWTGEWLESGPRKRRVGFHFYMDEVVNYDQIDLADVEFYLHNRTDRGDYAEMMGFLLYLRKRRLAEMEKEKGLVRLLTDQMKVPEKAVWEAVDWWKYKNKWKRALADDDAKALRMIKEKLRKVKS